jgi:hypothetical protein
MPLTVLVDREAKKEVGECSVDAMMRVMDGRWKGTIVCGVWWMGEFDDIPHPELVFGTSAFSDTTMNSRTSPPMEPRTLSA